MPKEQTKPKDTCPICLAAIRNETITSACTHRFCHSCLFEWSKTQNTCPVCKIRFNKLLQTQNNQQLHKTNKLRKRERRIKKETLIKYRDQDQSQEEEIFSLLQVHNTRSREVKFLTLFSFLDDIIKE